jgi:hypothetical protein
MNNNRPQEKLNTLVEKEEKPLKTIKTVFPFTLFPDSIEVYRNKVLIIRRYLPFGRREFPILMDDIKTITVTTSPFFASVFFEIKAFEKNPKPVTYLKRKDALEIRRLVTGLSLMARKNIRKSSISKKKLIKNAKKMG